MWLVLDLGNSAIKGGLFDGTRITQPFRIETADHPAWPEALKNQIQGTPFTRAGLTSVVPLLTEHVRAVISGTHGLRPAVIGPQVTLPFALAYETPHTLGTDRLAAAAAAWMHYGAPVSRSVVALDAGTAVTLDVVDRHGTFRGGIIAAGPVLLRRALRQGTAQLPEVPLELPPSPIGRSTRTAIQAGLMYGFIESVGGMLRHIQTTLDDQPLVVATGGWSSFLQQHLPAIGPIEPHLVLLGIGELLRLNPDLPDPS